jgi:hypothetical protein
MAWVLQSRKGNVALGSVVSIVLAHFLPQFGFSADEVHTISEGVMIIGGVWIAGIAHEDAAKKKNDIGPDAKAP